jgi:hypothetical protein
MTIYLDKDFAQSDDHPSIRTTFMLGDDLQGTLFAIRADLEGFSTTVVDALFRLCLA